MNPCERIGHLIGSYLYGDAAPDEAHAVESHLAICPRCRRDVGTRRAALAALPPPAPTERERQRILEAVRAAAMGADAVCWHATRQWRALAIAGAAAAAAVLFVGGMWVGEQRASAPATPRATLGAAVRAVTPVAVVAAPEPMHPVPAPPKRPAREAPPVRRLPAPPPVRHAAPAAVVQAPRVVAPVPEGVDDIRLAALEE